ncbi:hypothetical protein TCAL_00576 [Tigriopus californicus]|uniref:PNPLA domain-containing protein n=2 Tax=Tigriopus californicus TaxID=6832 RepID=A0A553PAE7_TIGCA|nr:hypothetical protein TCAL_00576 [Tigriopus californicus]|eukprot:TCALIF_00576-PA protein Name:"Similar to PNPLA8 Calcium-independent phospholipase A2-gamma (Oryctolagus cuniculus)" AED:0.06 eAED:0.06 QI:0/-1/0/1/-1/1/1/0/580
MLNPKLSEEDFQEIRRQHARLVRVGGVKASETKVSFATESQPSQSDEVDLNDAIKKMKMRPGTVDPAPASASAPTSFFSTSFFMDTILSVPTAILPKLPNVQDFLPFGKVPSDIPPSADVAADLETETTPWRRPYVRSAQSKAAIDARTRSCVANLRSTASLDSAVLKPLEVFNNHLYQYPFAKGVAVRSHAVSQLLHIRDKSENESVKMVAREGLNLLGYQEAVGSQGIRILCLDGGGMKGIIALEVLKRIELTTGRRIYEVFDFICGVSTGSIIASLLAFHKMSVNEVASAYKTLGAEVFKQNMFSGATGYLRSHSYYNTLAYERVLQSFVGNMVMGETARTPRTPKVAIVATLVNTEPMGPFVFRNYHYPYRSPSNFKGSSDHPIWAAVRGSSAAPGYFDEFCLEDKIFHDGGIMTNNATMIAIHEAQRLWAHEALHCVVSLGMGRFKGPIHPEEPFLDVKKPKNLSLAQKFSRIIDAATDTELAHVSLHDLLPGEVYFRFNPYLSEYFDMDEVRLEKMSKMREDTQMYIRRNENRFDEVCQRLVQPRSWSKRARDHISLASHYVRAQLDKGAVESQ